MPPEQRLADIFADLAQADRHALLAFAEFLAAGRHRPSPTHAADAPVALPLPPADAAAAVPNPLPRPAEERVIAAIRRLGLGYPMLDRGSMLHETAALMSQHVVQGRPAAAIIDDLEALFERHYALYSSQLPGGSVEPASDAGGGSKSTPGGGARPNPHG